MFIIRQGIKGNKKGNKFEARRVVNQFGSFDSTFEFEEYLRLRDDEQRGMIKCLKHHHALPLNAPDGTLIGHYEADFYYFDLAFQSWVVLDAKGVETDLFRWKWKHAKAQYPTYRFIISKRPSKTGYPQGRKADNPEHDSRKAERPEDKDKGKNEPNEPGPRPNFTQQGVSRQNFLIPEKE